MSKSAKREGFRRVDIQVAIFTAIVAVVSCILISTLYFTITHRDMIRGLEDRVYAIHQFVTEHMDEKAFFDINTPEDMKLELYEQVHSVFRTAHDLTGVMYLYSAKRSDAGELVYVVDCIEPSQEDFRKPGDAIEPEIIPELETALSGKVVMPNRIKSTDWGKIFIAYLPVIVHDEVVGVIGIEFEAEHQFDTFHFLIVFAPFAALIICLVCAVIARYLFQRISNPLYKDMVNTDYLTDLKSRNAFDVDVKNLGASKKYEGIGFFVMDLNNLKKVNDTLGHESGDIYLQLAADTFREAAGDKYSVYRTGGDEFVMISVGDTYEQMELLANKAITIFDRKKPDWEIGLSFAIGFTLYDAKLDTDLSDTYKRADSLMYEQKRAFHAKKDAQ